MTEAASNRASWTDRYLPGAGEADHSQPAGLINLSMIRGLLFRQRIILTGVVLAALVLGLVTTLLTKPIYQSTATVRIDPDGANIVQGQDLAPTIATNEIDRYMKTQGSVIMSQRMAFRVVDSLKLDQNDAFLGKAVSEGKPAEYTAKQWQTMRREMAAGMVQGGVGVDIPIDNRVISINYSSGDPTMAKVIADAYADNFVQEDVRRALEANTYAQKYLQEQIAQISAKLQDAEMAANAYAKSNRIVSSPLAAASGDKAGASSAGPTITVANLASVNGNYTQARAQRIATEQRWAAVSGMPALQLPEVQQNSAIQNLYSERGKVITQLSELRQRYGDSYPQVKEAKAQVASLDAQINRLGSDIKNSIRDQYQIALRQEQALSGELTKVSDQTLDEQDRRVRFNLLDREAGALRTQLAALLERYNQISSAANVRSGSISKLDAATQPGSPVTPNLIKNMLVALIMGVAVAVILAVLREAFDDRLRSSDDVERKLGVPLLGFTPYLSSEEVTKQAQDPFSSLMESYSSLRTSIDFAITGNHRVIQITSSQPSEGKSLTSSVIAKKYAELGRKTLLIDADLRKPTIAHLFGSKRSSIGFAEVLLGDVPLADALLKNTPDSLDVLPIGSIPTNPVELLSSQLLSDFIARCRDEYSLIIIDSSPVMGLADAPLISRHVDGVVFIVEANRSQFGQTKAAIRRLRNAGARIAGAVLTKYRSAEAGLSYDYIYNYYSYGSKTED
ncbi:polysaccharide biosynthesis tyrosine autokinase [Novosphingobium sp. MMS21-SN21R]|uniref:GumC family protein n=1 Tax=Novosphingobium sp. MMS21-SN21R TaxID=2969298 RepID=UPI002883BBF9|nr:polysaccharide biosynthesis tyrosine autokinase [Novosphingobium sp. MMS21-SN21R]MDT0509466.1 polysaccharide biosynthesis tyrosine autokinase [Novosphingobium sp. MMS21-SN21R]